MGDELDPYGLLEQAYDEAVGENIEDVSPANSSSRDEESQHVDTQESPSQYQQRSFIAHKDMRNVDLETNDDNPEEEEDQEKLQFEFDVPSPTFEAISDDESAVVTNPPVSELNTENVNNTYSTPLNSTAHDVGTAENIEQDALSFGSPSGSEKGDGNSKSNSDIETSSGWVGNVTTFKDKAGAESDTSLSTPVLPASEGLSEPSTTDRKNDSSVVANTTDYNFTDPAAVTENTEDDNIATDIDAPVPSPFSDIGDISGPENAMIRDILKETGDGIPGMTEELESQGEPVLDMDSKTENQEEVSKLDDTDGTKSDATREEPTDDNQLNPTADDVSDEEQGSKDVGGLIADIFGESDEEEEEFEGFAEEELYPEKAKEKPKSRAIISDDEDEEEADDSLATGREEAPALVPEESSDEEVDDLKTGKEEMISDFDLMMQRKKEINQSKRRGRRDFDIINDNDDIIAAMIKQMKDAAEEDRLLNQAGQAATKKLKMLPSVISHLRKADLQHTFIDCGILPVIKEWLSPLPDNSLPHIQIRSSLLRALSEFPPLDKGALKMSGVGRSVMLLFKHPKECRPNRKIAGKIISEWARPIFGVTTKFSELSREDREDRDKMTMPAVKKRRLSSVEGEPAGSRPIDQALNEDIKARRPGDKGFVGRARVPMPSNRDYVVRPKSNVEVYDVLKTQKKSLTRFDQQYRKYKDRLGALGQKGDRAVGISLNGSKMSL